jgi:hypothetical protein
MKVDAQIWVTQRVRNSAGSVTSRGLNPVSVKKMRVWSNAMMAITSPRRISTEAIRAGLSGSAVADPSERVGPADVETMSGVIKDATFLKDHFYLVDDKSTGP